jgi:predicted lysophospholipase L1 biosynthesis ABC-type transport system permease subunit
VTYNFFLVRFRPGANGVVVRNHIETALRPVCARVGCNYFVDRRPNEVNAYGQVAWTPLLLAGILGALAAMALAHALVSSVRRRRLDLAILKTLGFTRAQVSMAVAWQATIIVLVAVAVGLPLGMIVGRWLWSSFAGELGVAPDSLLPVAALAVSVPAALVVGNLVASVPAWAAGRVQPNRILRAE